MARMFVPLTRVDQAGGEFLTFVNVAFIQRVERAPVGQDKTHVYLGSTQTDVDVRELPEFILAAAAAASA